MNKILQLTWLLSAVMLFFSCKHKQPPPNPAVPVNLITVKSQKVYYYDNFPATTAGAEPGRSASRGAGLYYRNIFYGRHPGAKGQKLYEIDKPLYQAAYDQAAANLQVAEGNQVQAKQDADRYTI